VAAPVTSWWCRSFLILGLLLAGILFLGGVLSEHSGGGADQLAVIEIGRARIMPATFALLASG
jgi:hypothetical protein